MLEMERLLREHGERLDRQVAPVGMSELEQRIADDLSATEVFEFEQAPLRRWSSRFGPVVGVAAAAVFVAVGLGFVVASRSQTEPPLQTSPTTSTTLEPEPSTTLPTEPPAQDITLAVAEAFMQAWVAGDGEALVDMFAEDGTFEGWLVGPDQLPALHDFFRALGWTFSDADCRSASDSREIQCNYTGQDDLLTALGRGPATGSLLLEISDGKITRLVDQLNFDTYIPTWDTFFYWLQANHADDIAVMFYPDQFNPRLDPAAIALWERYTDDASLAAFARDVAHTDQARGAATETSLATAEDFLAAWIAGDGHAAARLFNADGTYGAGVVAPDQLPALHDWYRAVGWEFRDLSCEAESVATPNGEVVVNCTLTGDNDLGRALDWAPVTDNFQIVANGGLDRATEHFGFDAYRDLWFMFKDWVTETHPDDLERMFLHPAAPWPGVRTVTADPPFEALNAYPLLTDDSIGLWELHVDEFITSPTAVVQANEELEVAKYVAKAVSLCTAADAEFAEEVAGLMQATTDKFQQYHVGFSDLESVATWHHAQTRYADRVIAELSTLPVPELIADDIDRFVTLMQQETDLNRQVAAAAAAGDQSAVDTLTGQRVDATHAKDGLAFGIGYSLYACPVSSAGA